MKIHLTFPVLYSSISSDNGRGLAFSVVPDDCTGCAPPVAGAWTAANDHRHVHEARMRGVFRM